VWISSYNIRIYDLYFTGSALFGVIVALPSRFPFPVLFGGIGNATDDTDPVILVGASIVMLVVILVTVVTVVTVITVIIRITLISDVHTLLVFFAPVVVVVVVVVFVVGVVVRLVPLRCWVNVVPSVVSVMMMMIRFVSGVGI
jgi:hypothetical protein